LILSYLFWSDKDFSLFFSWQVLLCSLYL
jgi:hypothetical protein